MEGAGKWIELLVQALTAIGVIMTAINSRRGVKISQKNSEKLMKVEAKQDQSHIDQNSRLDQLLVLKGESEHAKGRIEGAAQRDKHG